MMRNDSRADEAGRPDMRLILGTSLLLPLVWLAMLAPVTAGLPF
jgi:hypothetical protein